MKRSSQVLAAAFVGWAAVTCLAQQPLGSGFTYQGQLKENGEPVDGNVNLALFLYNAATGGMQVGSPVIVSNQSVENGLFTAVLNAAGQFGPSAFTGERRWLEIWVNGVPLTPRQELTPTPYALYAARPWQTSSADVFYSAGNVGIGTSSPQARLHVVEGTTGTGLIVPGLRVFQNTTSPNLAGGYSGNTVTTGVYGATISGGGGEFFPGAGSPFPNRVFDRYCTVGGGVDNWAGLDDGDPESSGHGTVGGGAQNRASGTMCTVAGGWSNSATGQYATVGGGSLNMATGNYSTVPGGLLNTAQARYSFAAGIRAKALHDASFVWGDDSISADIVSTANNQWTARCAGGVRFFSNSDATTGVVLNPGSGSWSSASDRDFKENFTAVDPGDILERVVTLPISMWNYKSQEAAIRHIGPMAQDFHAAFGIGEDDRHISTVDADGVALAAVQGLYRLVQERDAEIVELNARLSTLESLVEQLLSQQVGGAK